ncbi:MAG: tellurite resistance TerB family protein [Hyphomicrobiaceae bacterium]|nr:tellurite resistance TerB family protein [Hyphomicrobiaceae bacterium]
MAAALSPQTALIYVMVTTAAVDRDMSDTELSRIGSIVSQFPVFDDFDGDKLPTVAQACGSVLREKKGLEKVLDLIESSLPRKLHETAYAAAVEVAAADLKVQPEEVRFLEILADRLKLDRLVTTAIERTARARHQTL